MYGWARALVPVRLVPYHNKTYNPVSAQSSIAELHGHSQKRSHGGEGEAGTDDIWRENLGFAYSNFRGLLAENRSHGGDRKMDPVETLIETDNRQYWPESLNIR